MIVVVGGTGRIGGALVRQLLEAGAPVRALVRNPAAARAALGGGVELVQGDLNAPESLKAAFAGVTSLFLLSTQSPAMGSQELAAIAAAKAAGVAHVVKVSAGAAAVSDRSPTPVGRTHWKVEAALKASGLQWTILRPSAFMQVAIAPLLHEARAKGRVTFPLGKARVAFIDVADIARVAAWSLTHRQAAAGRTLTLTGPESLDLKDLAGRIAVALSRPVKASSPPFLLARLVLARRIADPFLRRHQLGMLGLLRAGAFEAVSPDLENVTGRPGRSLADWLATNPA